MPSLLPGHDDPPEGEPVRMTDEPLELDEDVLMDEIARETPNPPVIVIIDDEEIPF